MIINFEFLIKYNKDFLKLQDNGWFLIITLLHQINIKLSHIKYHFNISFVYIYVYMHKCLYIWMHKIKKKTENSNSNVNQYVYNTINYIYNDFILW